RSKKAFRKNFELSLSNTIMWRPIVTDVPLFLFAEVFFTLARHVALATSRVFYQRDRRSLERLHIAVTQWKNRFSFAIYNAVKSVFPDNKFKRAVARFGKPHSVKG